MRPAASVAYVIVTYGTHARERGLSHLKNYIGTNPYHYAAHSLIPGNRWPQMLAMIDQFKAGWKRCLVSLQARQRVYALSQAFAEVKRV